MAEDQLKPAHRAALDVAIEDLDAAAQPTKSEVFTACGAHAADLRDAIKAALALIPAVSAERPGRPSLEQVAREVHPTAWELHDEIQRVAALPDQPRDFATMKAHCAAQLATSEARARNIMALFAHLAPVKADMLAWLTDQKRLELDYGFDSDHEDMFWRVHERTGNVNDQEWDLIGQGATPSEALLFARSFLESTAVPATPEGPKEQGTAKEYAEVAMANGLEISRLLMVQTRLGNALAKLVDACYLADAGDGLAEEIDGSLLDAAEEAIGLIDRFPPPRLELPEEE